VSTILLAGVDLFFRGKLEAVLPGHRFVTADAVAEPDLVICDIARIDPDDVVETYPDVPILGFTNHTDTAGLRAAHTAGFDHVVVKSALEERVKELIEELSPSLE
jgi:DNA-binding NarL/FixJ family response regulator